MLGGSAPIFLFNFFQLSPLAKEKISSLSVGGVSLLDFFPMVPIPIYLDEKLTGIYVDSENKNIDIETKIETSKVGEDPQDFQKALGATTTIEMLASSESIGLTILSAMMDVVLPKVTSKEYSISYLNGATTIFNAKLQTFSISQNTDNNLFRISVVLSTSTNKTSVAAAVPLVSRVTGAVPL
jgi:hypothetical protein